MRWSGRGRGGRSAALSRGTGVGDGDGNTSSLAGGLDSSNSLGLVGSLAALLHTGLDLGKERVTLLAVAGKVGKVLAAVTCEGTDEAGKSALRDVVELSTGDRGQGDDGGDGEGLHFGGCLKLKQRLICSRLTVRL